MAKLMNLNLPMVLAVSNSKLTILKVGPLGLQVRYIGISIYKTLEYLLSILFHKKCDNCCTFLLSRKNTVNILIFKWQSVYGAHLYLHTLHSWPPVWIPSCQLPYLIRACPMKRIPYISLNMTCVTRIKPTNYPTDGAVIYMNSLKVPLFTKYHSPG